MTKRRCLAGVLVLSLLAMLVLPGCGALGEPASTESLLVRYAAHEDSQNCHATAEANLTLSLVGYRVAIPVTADVDIVDRALHGTVHADLSKLGVNDYDAEVYAQVLDNVVKVHVGAHVKDSVVWKDFNVGVTGSVDALGVTSLLSGAEFNRIALESDDAVCYELDVPTTTILDTALSIVNVADLPDEFDADLLREALAGDKIKTYFTKDCLIHSVATVSMGTYSGEMSKGIPVSIKADGKATLGQYGEIDPASVLVPDNVSGKSTHTTLHEKDPFGILAVVGEDNPLAQRVNG